MHITYNLSFTRAAILTLIVKKWFFLRSPAKRLESNNFRKKASTCQCEGSPLQANRNTGQCRLNSTS